VGAGNAGNGDVLDPEVERLIEEGLERYGRGDLEGALLAWEGALALAPDDARALGYVDYVRSNYQLLTGSVADDGELAVPFGLASLDDDAAYELEIERAGASDAGLGPGRWGEASEEMRARVERYIEAIDDGWFLREDGTPVRSLPLPPRPAASELGDDDKTYDKSMRPSDPALRHGQASGARAAPPATSFEFTESSTSDRTADLKGRSLGWVRPVQDAAMPPPAAPAAREAASAMSRGLPGVAWASADANTAELRVRIKPDPLENADGEELAEPDDSEEPEIELLETEDAGRGPSDEELTIERDQWRRTSTQARTHERIPPMADLDVRQTQRRHPPPALDADEGDHADAEDDTATHDPAETQRRPPVDLSEDRPLVIVEDPVLADAATFRKPRARGRAEDSDEFESVATAEHGRPDRDLGLAPVSRTESVSMEVVAHEMLAELERTAHAHESRDDRIRRRIGTLLDRAATASRLGHHPIAVTALDLALAEEPDSAVAQKLIHRSREQILGIYQLYLSDLRARPILAVPMHDLATESLDSRAAFLLSRIDGNLSFEEILDVAGMTRLEAFRYLARLLLRGILDVR